MNWIQQYSFIDVVCLSTRKCEKMSWIYLPIFYTNLDALTSKDSCNKSADAFIEERVEHRSPSSSWNAYCTGSFVWVKRACNQRLRNTCSNGENKLWYSPSMADSCWYRYSLLLTSLIVVNEILYIPLFLGLFLPKLANSFVIRGACQKQVSGRCQQGFLEGCQRWPESYWRNLWSDDCGRL